MKNISDYFMDWELLLIPVLTALGFGAILIYLSMVLSDGNATFRDVRDFDFPILESANQNLDRYNAIVVALNSAAETGEVEYLNVAQGIASEIINSYVALEKIDAKNKNEIESLKAWFNAYFSLAIEISHQFMSRTGSPSVQQISKMRAFRDLYSTGSLAYREAAKNDFQMTVSEAIRRSERAKIWGIGIGIIMLFIIASLTTLVRRDIAKRKKMELALHASVEDSRIAATAFETHDGILITDASANIVRVNRAFTEITGYSAEESIGKKPNILSSGRQDMSFYIKLWQQLLQTGSWVGEVLNRRKSGDVYPEWLTITAVKNENQVTTHYVGIFSDISERKKAEEEIRSLAFYDALTKLPNRRLLIDRFQTALIASARRNDFGAVLFLDMDRFKLLNDTLGHDYGDLLLIEVGMRIKSCVREIDTVARFGGDEFVVLIEATSDDREDAMCKVAQIAEKIREALAWPYMLKEREHFSSPSIGVRLFHGNDDPLETLLEHADMAMYQAKKSGRNAVRLFEHP